MFSKKSLRLLIFFVLIIILTVNTIAVFQAYKFTHYDGSASSRTKVEDVSWSHKLKAMVLGVDLPRPEDASFPTRPYETLYLHDEKNRKIEAWLIRTDSVDNSKGTVIFCHGYGCAKSEMLPAVDVFLDYGYNAFLFDFMGSGGSDGNQTTIGFYEAEQVKAVFEYVSEKLSSDIILFGTSMGAAAIMKAGHDYKLNPEAVILECPYSTMLRTVQNRFENVGVPKFPMSNLLVLWGGLINGFNAFDLNPVDYGYSIECPVLLIYGQKDDKVRQDETDDIFNKIKAKNKRLVQYPEAGHANYHERYKDEWTADNIDFLESL